MLHGVAGFGKTVLAAEAVRDAKILSEAFSGKCVGGWYIRSFMF